MSGRGGGGHRHGPWPRAVAALHELRDAIRDLESDYPATVEVLRGALHRLDGSDEALLVLRLLNPEYTAALVDDLVWLSVSHRHAGSVRESLGRLPHRDVRHVVPPAVWRQLGKTADDDAYRRLAELLEHLGLAGALTELVQRAQASDDPDIREIAEDFRSQDG